MILERLKESSEFIRKNISVDPKIAIILGSGLGGFIDGLENKKEVNYEDIPHFVSSTAPGHSGKLVSGYINDIPVICMQGRLHYYEGYSMQTVTYPIQVMAKLGIEKLLITNSSGGLYPDLKPGELMLVTDHINYMGDNPLIGKNIDELGPRFPDLTYAYDKEMNDSIRKASKDLDIKLHEGIYVGYSGPSFETPAEIRMFQMLGGGCIGMSTVPEVIMGNYLGLKVATVSCITNLAAGILDQPLTSEEVLINADKSSKQLIDLLSESIKNIYK